MPVKFGNVKPGLPLGSAEAERLRGEIYAVLSGMNTLNVGAHCTIRDFKLDDGRKIQVTARVTAVNGNELTVDLS